MYNINELLPYNLILEHPYTIEVSIMFVSSNRGSEVIQLLSQKYPFIKYNLSHLKRAKKSKCINHIDLIIAPKDDIEEFDELEPYCSLCNACGMFKTVNVPRIPPYTKKQLVE